MLLFNDLEPGEPPPAPPPIDSPFELAVLITASGKPFLAVSKRTTDHNGRAVVRPLFSSDEVGIAMDDDEAAEELNHRALALLPSMDEPRALALLEAYS